MHTYIDIRIYIDIYIHTYTYIYIHTYIGVSAPGCYSRRRAPPPEPPRRTRGSRAGGRAGSGMRFWRAGRVRTAGTRESVYVRQCTCVSVREPVYVLEEHVSQGPGVRTGGTRCKHVRQGPGRAHTCTYCTCTYCSCPYVLQEHVANT